MATDPLGLTDTETVTISVEDVIEKYGDNPADNTIELDHAEFSGDTPITGGIENLSVDIVIPLSDKYSYGEGYDNRASSGTTISSMAFVPGATV